MPNKITNLNISVTQSIDIQDILKIIENCGLSNWTADGIQAELKRMDSLALSVKQNTKTAKAVGFLIARMVPGGEIDILNFGVLPDFQKKGVGSLLWKHLLRAASENFAESIWLEVRESNVNARRFYEKRGFTAVQTRKGFYTAPRENAVLMKLSTVECVEKTV